MLFWFSVTNRLKMVLVSHNDQIYPCYPLVLKFNVTLAQPLRVVILYFLDGNSRQMIGAHISMIANETPDLMWTGLPIQNNC